jgi:hypothetical protein
MAKRSKSGGGGGKFFLGFLLALILAGVGAYVYLHSDKAPLIVAKTALPVQKQPVRPPVESGMGRELKPPFGIGEDVFEAGARVYRTQCALCHGTPGHDAGFARRMDPAAPQLWKKHTHGNVVGVSDDEPGETYWKIANGIHQSGMPSYKTILSDTQMWQVSLLLKNADQPLPDPVEQILNSKP